MNLIEHIKKIDELLKAKDFSSTNIFEVDPCTGVMYIRYPYIERSSTVQYRCSIWHSGFSIIVDSHIVRFHRGTDLVMYRCKSVQETYEYPLSTEELFNLNLVADCSTIFKFIDVIVQNYNTIIDEIKR